MDSNVTTTTLDANLSIWEQLNNTSLLQFGSFIENVINTLIGIIILTIALLFVIRWIERRFKIDKINYLLEKFVHFLIDITPPKMVKVWLTNFFKIEAETFLLLPKSSARNYKHLGYQLNGLNRFLEKNEACRKRMKIILIDNTTSDITDDDLENFIKTLSNHKRYIIIATMSDIFDSLLKVVGHRLNNKNYRKMVKIIATLASQSEEYRNYEHYDNVIRLSPPDFDEARKAASNLVTKLISSYCPSKSCEYHKNNNIIFISSNSYGYAVKKSVSKLFGEYKEEFDTSTNIHVDEHDLNRGIFKYAYHYTEENGIVEDVETNTNYTFDALLEEKANGAINTIFLIGYEPNISNMLKAINEHLRLKKLRNCEFSLLISATASVKEWRESIVQTINELDIKSLINEINYVKIEYPKFKADDNYHANQLYINLYKMNKTQLSRTDLKLEFNEEEIQEIIYKTDMNYINGFIYMSLELVQQINADWEVNLLSLKEKLFHNKDRNHQDIMGVKILSSGDSINHFKVKKLKLR
ncbi:MAG TPA: hypothetical protein ENK86_00540 [Campylobacterales bacterium]|nr:hypothetical protein [Campylobacterales bacterium]